MNRTDARIPYCSDELLAEHGQLLESITTNFGFIPASFRTLAHKPDLLRAVGDLSAAVMGPEGATPERLRWMVSYVSSMAAGCTYCSAHTAHNLAEVCDVDHATVDDLWRFEASERFTEAERAALRVAVAAGASPGAVTDDLIADLSHHFSAVQIVELVGAISLFGFLNRWNSALGTPLEEGPKEMLASLTHTPGTPNAVSAAAMATSPATARTRADQAYRAGPLIFVTGQLALDDKGALVGRGDALVQAEHCLRNIEDALAPHGASLGDLVKLTCYLVDGSDYPAYADAKARLVPHTEVASTTVIIRDLLVADALLEVEAVAVGPQAFGLPHSEIPHE
jgi:uncharacterized peroxidase-related enzyme